jgi:hypothetical protein
MPRYAATVATFQPNSTGRLSLHAIRLRAGDVLTSISFMSGGTAGATLTHVWFALYDANRALLRVTADDTAATWAASTVKTLTLASSYTVPADGTYYLGGVVVGTTMPTLQGSAGPTAAAAAVAPVSAGTSTTGLVAPATAPNPAAALTAIAGTPLAWVS